MNAQRKEKINLFAAYNVLLPALFCLVLIASIADAANYYTNDFSTNTGALSLEPKWQRVATGGIANSPCIKLTYDTSGTTDNAAILGMSQYSTNAVWVKFAYKITGTPTGGSKFLKFFGSAQPSMNNTTFMMNYYTSTIDLISYYGDTICEAYYGGGDNGSCQPRPSYNISKGEINHTDQQWHTYKAYLKRADAGARNGVVRVFDDGVEVFNMTNVDNNPPSGYTSSINRIEWGGYRDSRYASGTWYLWVDDVTVSDTDPDTSSAQDTQAPTAASSIAATPNSNSQVDLSWGASTDNVAVTGYRIYRNGAFLKTVAATSASDSGLATATTYTYNVSAIDAANNESIQSPSAIVTTLSTPPTTPPVAVINLLTERFEDALFSSRGWFDDGTGNSTVVTDSIRGKVLEISYASGATTPSSGILRHLFTEANEVYISYWIKYQNGWRWTGLGYGPHEFYLLTNLDDRWIGPASTHLTTYIEGQEGVQNIGFQDALNIDQTKIGTALKGITENRGVMGCNGASDSYTVADCYNRGDGFYLNGKLWKASMAPLSLNVWHNMKVRIKLNTIVNNVGQADGIIQYWLDDVSKLDLNNVVIRTGANPTLKFNQFIIGPYFHNGTPQNQKFWIDDLQITSGIMTTTTLKINEIIK